MGTIKRMGLESQWTADFSLRTAQAVLNALAGDQDLRARIEQLASRVAACFRSGGKVLICGNGGSACDAAHFAEELTGRFRSDRPPLPALACTDAGHITCTANDYGYHEVFARWIEALAGPPDVVILLSTSGNSESILRAADVAKDKKAFVVSLLGRGGGKMRGKADLELIVPGEGSDRIQEIHMLILHMVVEGVEQAMFGNR